MPRSSRTVKIDTMCKILEFMKSIDAIFAIPVWFMSLYLTSFYSLWLMIPVTFLLGFYLYYTMEHYRWAFDMAKSLASDAMARAALWSSGSSSSTRSSRRQPARGKSPGRQPARGGSPGRQPARGSSPGRQSGWGGARVEESLLPSMRYGSGNSVRQPAEGGARARSPGRQPAKGGARAQSPGRQPAKGGARGRSPGRGGAGDKLPPREWNSRTKTWFRPV